MKGFIFLTFFISMPVYASHVVFTPQAHIMEKSPIYLSDVAILNTDDDFTISALKSIKIADSAQDAERLTAKDIIKIIRPQIRAIERHCECKLNIEIPKEIMEHSLNGEFNQEKLQKKMELGIREHCPECIVDIENTHIIRGETPVKYFHWSSPLVYRELKGPTMVRVFFDDNALNPVVYQSYIKIQKPVLKLKRALPAGSMVQKEDYLLEILDTTHESRPFATLKDLPGTEIKRSLGEGELLRLNDLVLKYQVRLGDPIKVIVRNSAISVEMSGIAQKNGRIGDKIPVRMATTRKEVMGEVLADGRVGL